MTRDELRSAALKSPPRKRVPVEYNGVQFELLAPTILQRKQILEKARSPGADSASIFEMAEWAAIYCTVIPGTKERIFEDTDQATLSEQAVNGFIDKVVESLPALLNTEEDPKSGNVA